MYSIWLKGLAIATLLIYFSAVAVLLRSCGLPMQDAGHDDAHVKKRLTPPGAKTNWRPVSLEQDMINVKGGYNTRGESGRIISYEIDKVTHVFVELDKNAEWFLKGVGGPEVQRGDLTVVGVATLLRETFNLKLGG